MLLKHRQQKGRIWPWVIGIIVLVVIVLALIGGFTARKMYHMALNPADPNNQNVTLVTIPEGSTPGEIAGILKSKKVIQQSWAFEWYVRNSGARESLEAGTYALKPSMSVSQITDIIAEGKVATDLVTILPAKRIGQIRQSLIEAGFSTAAVDKALQIDQYAGHPALAETPVGASLEGYLYPESFQKTSETTPETIVKASLDEMATILTPQVRAGLAKQGLSVHQGVILASIVEQEVSKDSERAQAAQVFLKRFRSGMQLGSDVTALYGAVINGKEPSVFYDSPYNTRIHNGLPPGPVSNVSRSSLQAVANPASTDWLYFVSGDDGITYFSKTLADHERLTAEHCKKLCKSY